MPPLRCHPDPMPLTPNWNEMGQARCSAATKEREPEYAALQCPFPSTFMHCQTGSKSHYRGSLSCGSASSLFMNGLCMVDGKVSHFGAVLTNWRTALCLAMTKGSGQRFGYQHHSDLCFPARTADLPMTRGAAHSQTAIQTAVPSYSPLCLKA